MMSAKQRADSSKTISPQPATISFLMSDCSSHRVMSLLIVNSEHPDIPTVFILSYNLLLIRAPPA